MSQTLLQPVVPLATGFHWATLGARPGVRLVWRWLMNEKQLATESLFTEDFEDTQWQDTQHVFGSMDVPVERYGAT
jgi:hypothetical protein